MPERPAPQSTLDEWLDYIGRCHPQEIELGLDRLRRVAESLALQPTVPIITVGGTNGKGSVTALLESILHQAGRRVGCYTSPHLWRFNERIRVATRPVDDASIVAALHAVDQARGSIALTYFEFATLAAMWLFQAAGCDAIVLEVGLGGRLDAVNLWDADCSVIVSVDLDHQAFLGDTRELIGQEKAGIFRQGRPAIIADAQPPQSVLDCAAQIGAPLQRIGVDFGFRRHAQQWDYQGQGRQRLALPFPALRGAVQVANAATALAALDTLADRLPVNNGDVRRGLLEVTLPGRFQVLPGRPTVVLDVAHNPHAVKTLVSHLKTMGFHQRTIAVWGMLADKDMAAVAGLLADQVDRWLLTDLAVPRGAAVDTLAAALAAVGVQVDPADCFADPASALARARGIAAENDRILVFGSFYTVAGALTPLQPTVGDVSITALGAHVVRGA